jgi:hypothetical protein
VWRDRRSVRRAEGSAANRSFLHWAARLREVWPGELRANEARVIRLTGDEVRLMIGNTPEQDIEPTGVHVHETADHHFELYYRLFATPPAVKPIPYAVDEREPVRVRPKLVVEPHRAGGVNCPPLLIE